MNPQEDKVNPQEEKVNPQEEKINFESRATSLKKPRIRPNWSSN